MHNIQPVNSGETTLEAVAADETIAQTYGLTIRIPVFICVQVAKD
ncbi:hypothetical protein [Tetragenococcus solitarius]|nr:hypothetical protein [Tetragenococcus solitarius]